MDEVDYLAESHFEKLHIFLIAEVLQILVYCRGIADTCDSNQRSIASGV